jgi:hypothetical protein
VRARPFARSPRALGAITYAGQQVSSFTLLTLSISLLTRFLTQAPLTAYVGVGVWVRGCVRALSRAIRALSARAISYKHTGHPVSSFTHLTLSISLLPRFLTQAPLTAYVGVGVWVRGCVRALSRAISYAGQQVSSFTFLTLSISLLPRFLTQAPLTVYVGVGVWVQGVCAPFRALCARACALSARVRRYKLCRTPSLIFYSFDRVKTVMMKKEETGCSAWRIARADSARIVRARTLAPSHTHT